MVSFSKGDNTMFCSRKIVPPGSRDRERVGQDVEVGVLEEFHQRVGRRAAVDDDAFAGNDQCRGSACDGALLGDTHVLAHRKGHSHQVGLVAWPDCFRAAANALHLALFGQGVDVAADGGFRGPQEVQQVPDADDRALLDQLQDQVMAFFF
jgi:hypothetical protein